MRNISEAADHLVRSSNERLRELATHDPDMIRDVAASWVATRHALAAAAKEIIVGNGRISYPSRMSVKNLADAVSASITGVTST